MSRERLSSWFGVPVEFIDAALSGRGGGPTQIPRQPDVGIPQEAGKLAPSPSPLIINR
jgi:hypothetical protein